MEVVRIFRPSDTVNSKMCAWRLPVRHYPQSDISSKLRLRAVSSRPSVMVPPLIMTPQSKERLEASRKHFNRLASQCAY